MTNARSPEGTSRLEVRGPLSGSELAAARSLVESATETDRVSPLSEHAMLHLRHGGDPRVRNLLLYAPDDSLAAYAHLDVTDLVSGASAELVVAPSHRRQGYGRALLEAVLAEVGGATLRLWAHGGSPAAAALAAGAGLRSVRELLQLRRPLAAPLPEVALPTGVSLRTFRTGEDEEAWLRVNSRAFAHHPEQGSWTMTDLLLREKEDWFDPDGFFLAERAGPGRPQLVGFHWTKVHGSAGHRHEGHEHEHEEHEEHGHERIGEVYVVGVDPDAQGGGLGKALTLAGLHHLRTLGLEQVMLYVDADNTAAVQLYERLGFSRWSTDVMYEVGQPKPPA